MASKSTTIFFLLALFCLISQAYAGSTQVTYCDYIARGQSTPSGRITFAQQSEGNVIITGQCNTGFINGSKWYKYGWVLTQSYHPWSVYKFQPQYEIQNGGTSAFTMTVWDLDLQRYADRQTYLDIWGPSGKWIGYCLMQKV